MRKQRKLKGAWGDEGKGKREDVKRTWRTRKGTVQGKEKKARRMKQSENVKEVKKQR